jgi:sulfate permease, SulP family
LLVASAGEKFLEVFFKSNLFLIFHAYNSHETLKPGEEMVSRRRKKKPRQERPMESTVAASTTAMLRLDLLRTYQLAWLPGDILAGLVIFAVTIPAALAYGQLAGLQPINGLYASLLAMGVYAFFGTSRHLIIDAEAAIAILVASSLATIVADGNPTRFAILAMVQAIMVGGILVAAGVLRIGFIADFIPKSVVRGFLNGMALIIILALAGKICGIELTQSDFFPRLWEFFTKIHDIHRITLIVGGSCLSGLFLFRFIPKIPEAVLVIVLATAAAIWWNLGEHGITLVGMIPAGLPHPDLPIVSFADIVTLLPIATGIALVAFVDTTITGRAFAMKNGYRLDHNQELIALGLANVGTGLCHGFAVGSSHSRTAVNDMYGGRSQFAGLLAAGLLAVFMLRFTHVLKNVPVVALAAIIIVAAIRLFNFREITEIWRTRPASAYVSVATTFLVLITGLMTGILVSVAFAIILVLHRLARPHETVFRPRVPGSGLLVYRFAGPLFFFNAAYFSDRVQEIVETAEPPVNFLLINAEAIVDMDINAVEMLEELHYFLKRRNIILGICNVKGHFQKVLMHTHLTRRTGFNLYRSVATVVQGLTKGKPEADNLEEDNNSESEIPSV